MSTLFERKRRTVLKRQVLFAMGIDVVTHVPAQDLADVLPMFAKAGRRGSIKPHILGDGPGFIRLNFSKACAAGSCLRPGEISTQY